MKLHVFICGSVKCDEGLLFKGEPSGSYCLLPVTCFLLEHPYGNVLWDTGMNPRVRVDPLGHWGGVAKRLLIPMMGEGESIVERLEFVGLSADDVDIVLNSHLHNDHSGMNYHFTNARVLVRRAEYDFALSKMDTPSSGFIRADFQAEDETENRAVELIAYEDEYDLFGDGSVCLVSTIGHTPGHQCMMITFPSGRCFVLSGDAAYDPEQICSCTASGISWDQDAMIRSLERLRDLQDSGAEVLVAHDRARWGAVESHLILHEEASA